MPQWAGSDRRSRLPADWDRIRKRILRRDGYQCRFVDEYEGRCTDLATDVDHIRAGDDHRESNLQSLCGVHHRRKSSKEGAEAQRVRRQEIGGRFRRTEAHPGLI